MGKMPPSNHLKSRFKYSCHAHTHTHTRTHTHTHACTHTHTHTHTHTQSRLSISSAPNDLGGVSSVGGVANGSCGMTYSISPHQLSPELDCHVFPSNSRSSDGESDLFEASSSPEATDNGEREGERDGGRVEGGR